MTARVPILLALAVSLCVFFPREAFADRAVVVKAQDITPYNLAVQGFKRVFDGEVIVIELSKKAVTAAQVSEIRDLKPVAIIAIGSQAASSLKEQIEDIPIIFCMVMNARARGLFGPNITGIDLEIPARAQLDQFSRVVPGLERVGILHNPERKNPAVVSAKRAAREAGISVVERLVTSPGEVPAAIDGILDEVDGLWLLPDASLITNETFRHILVSSLQRRVPLFVFSAPFVRAGALAGIAPNYTRIGEEAAAVVQEVMKGANPGSIPTRDPPSAVVVNASTAARIGIELTAELRASATILQ